MTHDNSPSSVMYATLKALGVNNHDAALVLLDTGSSFGRTSIRNRIESRPQLSRSIVHVAPGELNISLFRNFTQSVPQLMNAVLESRRVKDAQEITRRLSGPVAHAMQDALQEYGIDPAVYRNALIRIVNTDLQSEMRRAELCFALFIVTGCTGDAKMAVQIVNQMASKEGLSAFETQEATLDDTGAIPSGNVDYALGLMRIVEGRLKGTDAFYPLSTSERGTEIGAFATSDEDIADVDKDVSRHHARIFVKDGHWYIIGLGSTNGTTIITGDSKTECVVEPPKHERERGYRAQPHEIFPTDTICLGASTRFMVLPA